MFPTPLLATMTRPYSLSRLPTITSMAIQSDGKIVIGGQMYTGPDNPDFLLIRCNPDGTLDDSFAAAMDSSRRFSIGLNETHDTGRMAAEVGRDESIAAAEGIIKRAIGICSE